MFADTDYLSEVLNLTAVNVIITQEGFPPIRGEFMCDQMYRLVVKTIQR